MKYFTIEQRERLEQLLQSRAEQLRTEIVTALQRADANGLALPNYYADIDDASLADLQESLDIAEVERDARELKQVKEAIRRLHGPDFGLCVDCGSEIPFSRLSALPIATRCLPCQKAEEQRLDHEATAL